MSGDIAHFETFRAIAPAEVDDNALRKLMKKHGNDIEAINIAISNLWETERKEEEEWVVNSKNKKDNTKTVNAHSQPNRPDRNSGRGGRGRDRRGEGRTSLSKSAPPVSKPDQSLPKDQPVTKPESPKILKVATVDLPVTKSAIISSSSTSGWGSGMSLAAKLKKAELEKENAAKIVPEQKVSESKETGENSSEQEVINTSKDVKTVSAVTEKIDGEANGKNDGAKKTPRQRNRRSRGKESKGKGGDALTQLVEDTAEMNVSDHTKPSADNDINVSAPVTTASSANQVSKSKNEPANSNVNTKNELPMGSSMQEEAQTQSQSAVGQGFLKMGKWEAPIESSTDISSFQFGSFGSFNDEVENSKSVSVSFNGSPDASTVSGAKANTAWKVSEEATNLSTVSDSANSGNIWPTKGNSTSNTESTSSATATSSSMNSLFPQSSVSGASTTRAPPGLESNNLANAPNKAAAQNNRPNKQSTGGPQHMHQNGPYPQHQYAAQQLPPGIPTGVNRPNLAAPTVPLSVSGFPYGAYPPALDPLSQHSQFVQHHPYNAQPSSGGSTSNSLLTSTSSSASSTNTTTQTAGTTSTTATATPSANLPQQQYATPINPYFGNPYYNQAYFYGQQVPNYYGQGRGMYQQRGPFPDPYGSNGSLYPGEVYQGAQFSEASANYGSGMSMHQGRGNDPNHSNASSTAPNNSNNKTMKGNPSASQLSNGHGMQDHSNAHFGYVNPYNSRVGMDQWQYQQNQQAVGGWGAPVMDFPPNTSQGVGNSQNQGFSQHNLAMNDPNSQRTQGNRGDRNNQGKNTANYGSSFADSRPAPTAGAAFP